MLWLPRNKAGETGKESPVFLLTAEPPSGAKLLLFINIFSIGCLDKLDDVWLKKSKNPPPVTGNPEREQTGKFAA